MTEDTAPAVPDDVAMPALLASHVEWLRGDHEACNPWLADMIEAQAAELARLRIYATHKRNCDMMSAFTDAKSCTCGFAAITQPTGDRT